MERAASLAKEEESHPGGILELLQAATRYQVDSVRRVCLNLATFKMPQIVG